MAASAGHLKLGASPSPPSRDVLAEGWQGIGPSHPIYAAGEVQAGDAVTSLKQRSQPHLGTDVPGPELWRHKDRRRQDAPEIEANSEAELALLLSGRRMLGGTP